MTESPSAKVLVRMAQEVRDQLLTRQACRSNMVLRHLDMLIDQWKEIQSGRRRLAVCAQRNWPAAGNQVARQTAATLRNVPYYFSQAQQALDSARAPIPSVRDIVEELRQVAEEFGQIVCDVKAQRICVTTGPIALEDVYLGPFEIQLYVRRIGKEMAQAAFDVVAQDPHPSSTNSSVTHPHVSDDRLCCGDASVPIQAALEAGRLGDFFCLVRSVLATYNPGSPYVPLENWNGRSCYDCGTTVPEDETYWCENCGNDFCESCCTSCAGCSETTCDGCLTECEACEDRFCRSCITTCGACGRKICTTCLEDAQCPCIEEEEEPEDDQDTEEEPRPQGGHGTEATVGVAIEAAPRAGMADAEPPRRTGAEAA